MLAIRHHSVAASEQDLAQQLAVLSQAIPLDTVLEVAAAHARPKQRRRKLPLPTLLLLVVTMSIYTQEALEVVFVRLCAGLREQWPDAAAGLATRSALCQGRQRLGLRPVIALFHRIARPLATPATPGGFLWGMRLLALDGTTDVVPDSPANSRAFGRPTCQHGAAAYPQVQGIYLVEVGTHLVLDATFWPYATTEHIGARRLLRAVHRGALLLADAGFYSALLLQQVRKRGAHLLCRLPAGVILRDPVALPDGSVWAFVQGTDQQGQPLRVRVRVISYRLTDPARPHYGETRRLVTTLLDAERSPALDLILAYHERWEVEQTISELGTRQRLAAEPLRSQTPLGVLQELYGLLLAHYALRTVVVQAAALAGVDPDRISFTRTIHLVAAALPIFQVTPRRQHARLYARLLADIGRSLLPERANRSNPRVVKRPQSKFPRKRSQHLGTPPLQLDFHDAFVLLPGVPAARVVTTIDPSFALPAPLPARI
jgi:hypothetical protein